jgi:hypothetical protein
MRQRLNQQHPFIICTPQHLRFSPFAPFVSPPRRAANRPHHVLVLYALRKKLVLAMAEGLRETIVFQLTHEAQR